MKKFFIFILAITLSIGNVFAQSNSVIKAYSNAIERAEIFAMADGGLMEAIDEYSNALKYMPGDSLATARLKELKILKESLKKDKILKPDVVTLMSAQIKTKEHKFLNRKKKKFIIRYKIEK